MTYFNKTIDMTKKYVEQLKADGIATVIASEKGENVKRTKKESNKSSNVDEGLKKLSAIVRTCKKCHLSASRKNAVFGEGNPKAELMFVGEGPGFDEDQKGRPFIGRAGKLLDEIITQPKSLGLKREDVFIANIVKCHPMIDPSHPDNRGNDRPPNPEEISTCIPYLEKQIELIKPKIICALGSVAAKTLIGMDIPIGKLRGKFYDYKGIKLIPTYHPAALLRNPNWKVETWEDIKKIKAELKKQKEL
ncbi:MAG: uracil-DNA glycosylase [Elusimicrobia bacterium]|nr:uracil-DNA glycosylase [Elusimicrobiota bacterium]